MNPQTKSKTTTDSVTTGLNSNNNDNDNNNNNDNNENNNNDIDDERQQPEFNVIVMDSEGHVLIPQSIKNLTDMYLKGELGNYKDETTHKKYMDMCNNIKDMAPPPRKRARKARHGQSIVCVFSFLCLYYCLLFYLLRCIVLVYKSVW